MSLLADLLSKIKHNEQHGAIPPNLAQVVQHASNTRKMKTKITVILCVFALLLAMGFGTVYFINSYLRPTLPLIVEKRVQEPIGAGAVQPPAATDIIPAGKVETPAAASAVLPASAVQATVAPSKPVTKVTGPVTGTATGSKDDVTPPPKQKGIAKQEETKNLLPEKIKTTSGISEGSRAGKDVALYAAKSFEEEKNYSQAIIQYKKALERDPRNYLIMNKLAGVLLTTGSYKESAQYSANALTIQKNYMPSLINLAIANIQLGNMTEGEMYLVKAKSLEPSSKIVLFNLGLLYEKVAKYDEALPLFRRLADMNDIQGNLGMARILEKQGKRAEAENIYKQILWMDNADPATKQLASERLQATR